jgi:hypothetical protein
MEFISLGLVIAVCYTAIYCDGKSVGSQFIITE